MSRSATSDAVNETVEIIRAHLRAMLAQQKERLLTTEELTQVRELGQLVANVENNRAGWVIAMIAGRRGLDKVPASEMDLLLSAIATPDAPAPVAEVPPPVAPALAQKKRRRSL